MTRLAYLGLLCKNSRTSVGYQYVAKKVIRRSAISMLQRNSYVGRLSVCCKDSHTGGRGSALSVLQRQSYRMTWFGYQVVAKTVIQDDVVRLSGCCKDSHTG